MSLSGDSATVVDSGDEKEDIPNPQHTTEEDESTQVVIPPPITSPDEEESTFDAAAAEVREHEELLRRSLDFITDWKEIKLDRLEYMTMDEGQTRFLDQGRVNTHYESVKKNPPSAPISIPVIDNDSMFPLLTRCDVFVFLPTTAVSAISFSFFQTKPILCLEANMSSPP